MTFDALGGTQTIQIICSDNKPWTLSGEVPWCKVSTMKGTNGMNITFTTQENASVDERNATYTFVCGQASAKLTIIQKQRDALTITSSKIEVPARGKTITIEVQSNIQFDYEIADKDRDWILPEETRAMQTTYLTFKVQPNENVSRREGAIIIKSEKVSETVNIYQNGETPSIILTQSDYAVSNEGETIKVEVSSNVDYQIKMPDVDWIIENKTRSMSTHTHYYTITPNGTPDNRNAQILFINQENSLQQIVNIIQGQQNEIIVSTTDYYIGNSASIVKVDIQSNINYSVEIPEMTDWISLVETRALQSSTVSLNISENTSGSRRVGKITLVNTDAHKEVELTIVQSAEYTIVDIQDFLFKTYLCKYFDKNGDGEMSISEMANIVEIDCSNLDITSLQGIEYAVNLQKLNCSQNKITAIDLSYNKNLKIIIWNKNPFCYINLGDISPYQYTENTWNDSPVFGLYDMVGPTLKIIGSSMKGLTVIECALQALDVSECPNLERLECYDNMIKSLDLSKNTKLKVIRINNNPLELIDLGRANVNIAENKLCLRNSTHIKVISEYLSTLWITQSSKLESIDVSVCPNLQTFYCNANNLKTLDVSHNSKLTHLDCNNNPLSFINLGNIKIKSFNLDADNDERLGLKVGKSKSLQVKSETLAALDVSGNSLIDIDISQCPNLVNLSCANNQVQNLNYANCPLEELNVSNNQLKELDLRNLNITDQSNVHYDGNPLTTIHFGNVNLRTWTDPHGNIFCVEPTFTKKSLCGSTELTITGDAVQGIDIHECELVKLDISKCPILEYLDCRSNQIKHLDISQNINLKQLRWLDNQFESIVLGTVLPYTTEYDDYTKKERLIRDGLEEYLYYGELNLNHVIEGGKHLKVSSITSIRSLDCSYCGLQTLDITDASISNLNCSNNHLNNIELPDAGGLYSLDCSHNDLTSLDLKRNVSIHTICAQNNAITQLNIRSYTKINNLCISSNKLTELNCNGLTALQKLECTSNMINNLSLQECGNLTWLSCGNNQIENLDVSESSLYTNWGHDATLVCAPMPTLKNLYLKDGWDLRGITYERSIYNIPEQTKIMYK